MSAITDVGGIRVGHHHRIDPDVELGSGWATGTTVVLTPPGTVGAVDCRGGAPGTRETDLLDPINSVRHVDAVVLTGGSGFGLAAAHGVMEWLEEQGRGVAMDDGVVPIVPAAVIFDLPVGGWKCRPSAEFGRAAAESAGTDVAVGTVGAGVGARVGVLKGGVGTASVTLVSGVTVGAVVVVNAAGDAVDPATGLPWLADQIEEFGLIGPPADQIAAYADRHTELSPLNTTIAVVATDAVLSKAGCRRMAVAAHDGLARTIRPCHTPARWRYGVCAGHRSHRGATRSEDASVDVAGGGFDHRARGGCRGLPGPCGHGRRPGSGVRCRNTDVPGHVARSVRMNFRRNCIPAGVYSTFRCRNTVSRGKGRQCW